MKTSSLLSFCVALAAMPIAAMAQSLAVDTKNTPGNAEAVYRITKPGSYHLTGNLAGVNGKAGIEITSSNVTLDLRGFALLGNVFALEGIRVHAAGRIEGVTIRNGSIAQWGKDGLMLLNSSSGELRVVETCLIEDIHVSRNFGSGIRVTGGAVVRGCTAVYNAGAGIVAGENSTVEGVTAVGNTREGIWLASGVIRGSTSRENSYAGFVLSGSGVVSECTASDNKDDGFQGWSSGVFERCNSDENGGWGFSIGGGGRIEGCNAKRNGDGGIHADKGYSMIVGNSVGYSHVNGKKSIGILAAGGRNRIEGNHASGLATGIHLSGTSGNSTVLDNTIVSCDLGLKIDNSVNFVARNLARNNNNNNFDIVAGNRVGNIVVPLPSPAIKVLGSGQSKGLGSTDPWANLSF